MPYRQLFVWVEGPDDERFVNTILRPGLERGYDWIHVLLYAGMRKEKITKFVESIRGMEDANYIFLADNDESPCVSAKKDMIRQKIKSLEPSHIAIVVKEIECWYLAGLNAQGCQRLQVVSVNDTNNLNKEEFDELRNDQYDSRIDWMIDMLRHYSLEDAVQRNASLEYFISRHAPVGTDL